MKRDEKKVIVIVGILPQVKLCYRAGSQLPLLNCKAAEREITLQLKVDNEIEERIMNGGYLN